MSGVPSATSAQPRSTSAATGRVARMIAAIAATTGHSMLPMYVVKKTPGSARLPVIPNAAISSFGKSFM